MKIYLGHSEKNSGSDRGLVKASRTECPDGVKDAPRGGGGALCTACGHPRRRVPKVSPDVECVTTSRKGVEKSSEKEHRASLDYRDCWQLLTCTCAAQERILGTTSSSDNDTTSSPCLGVPQRQWEVRAPHEQRQDLRNSSNATTVNDRSMEKVRRYRKKVSVRWGSLQWSLAMVLVVKSRSSSGPCKVADSHLSSSFYSPLPSVT